MDKNEEMYQIIKKEVTKDVIAKSCVIAWQKTVTL